MIYNSIIGEGTTEIGERKYCGDGKYEWPGDLVNIYNSTVGSDCKIAAFVEIGGAKIGDRCKIQAFAFICPGVRIEDDVFIGPRATFCNVLRPDATKPGEFMVTIVRKGASIGAGAIILPGIEIGESAMVGAGAVVTKDVAAHTTVVGCPARRMGK